MPSKKLPEKGHKMRVTVTLDPINKKHVDRRSTKENTFVSTIVNDLITQDRKKP
jgi:hypothetical protein